jgi:hypothetical protein
MKFLSPKSSCSCTSPSLHPFFSSATLWARGDGLETELHRRFTGSKDSSILRRRNLGHVCQKLISSTPFHSLCLPCQSPTRRRRFLSAHRLLHEPYLVKPIVRLTPWHYAIVVGMRFEQATAGGSYPSSGLGKCGYTGPDRHWDERPEPMHRTTLTHRCHVSSQAFCFVLFRILFLWPIRSTYSIGLLKKVQDGFHVAQRCFGDTSGPRIGCSFAPSAGFVKRLRSRCRDLRTIRRPGQWNLFRYQQRALPAGFLPRDPVCPASYWPTPICTSSGSR